MKILYVVNTLKIGGAEKMVIELAQAMSQLAEVHVLSLKSQDNRWGNKYLKASSFKILEWNYSLRNPIIAYKLLKLIRK